LQITHPEQVVGLAAIIVAPKGTLCGKRTDVWNVTTGRKRTSDELGAFVVGLRSAISDD